MGYKYNSLNRVVPMVGYTSIKNISRPAELFLLFWVDEIEPTVDTSWNPTGHLTGRDFFKEAAQTRLINLKTEVWYNSRIHKIHCPPIQYFSEIQTIIDNYLNKYGGVNKVKIREISFFLTVHGMAL